VAAATLSLLVLVVTGYGWSSYRGLVSGVHRSGTVLGLSNSPALGAPTNLLVMGLDSRTDESGNPLPPEVYQAMHTGGADVGGHNANVLMLLHLPVGGGRAVAMSIPRDDYVALAGAPDGTSEGKIKQAYGLAYDQQHRRMVAAGVTDASQLEQRSRDAGRNAEIATVSQFLGVPIDHFVEVTMAAFYQVAQVVQPITVCVKENTSDSYSGAQFHQGNQQIDAAQALAFVRQRRDTSNPGLNFSDLDRERRQQAFIASLATQLRSAGTFTDPARLAALIDVAKQNIAVDPGLDLLALAQQAAAVTSGNVTFTTLPIERFGTDPIGESINVVDPTKIRGVVQALLTSPATTPVPVPAPTQTVDVLNGGGRDGLAATVSRKAAAAGWAVGPVGNAAPRSISEVRYRADATQEAARLASALAPVIHDRMSRS
jgi:LCP family protein required for cell wall assembly